jgi:predicted Zn-dependent protease
MFVAFSTSAQPVGGLGPVPTGAAAAASLPRMGEAGAMDLSAERQLGDRIAQLVYQDPEYLDDPALGDYLRAIWQPLVASARERGDLSPELADRFAWELMLSRDASINAFALPGGYLGVHLGLVAGVDTTDQLASVLAHELSHVSQRHISRLVARQSQQAPLLLGAMILGALAASAAKNTDIVQAAVVGGQAVAAQTQLNFSRDMEREADRIGYGIHSGAGFDGRGFPEMFGKLQQASRLNDDGSFPYLRSHPLTSERMADMKLRHAQHSTDGPGPAPASPAVSAQWHAQMAARARVLAQTDASRWQTWLTDAGRASAAPTDVVQAVGARYGAALSALQLRQPLQAWQQVQLLLALPGLDESARRAAQRLALEIWLAPGAAQVATQPAAPPLVAQLPVWAADALASTERTGVLLGARAMVQQGQPAAASQRLQLWLSEHPMDAQAWRVLAQAWQAQGQPLRALRAEAESRAAVLDVDGAVDRLRAARDQGRAVAGADHLELSIIDARYRQLAQRQRELALERQP